SAVTKDLGVAVLEDIDNRGKLLVLGNLSARLGINQRPQLVDVHHRAPQLVLGLVEVTLTDLTEVTRMVLIHVDAVVVLTTSETTTSGMLAVLADTAVTGGHVSALLTGVRETGRLQI
ncbi:hypothetical protein GGH97_004303, partial [Coemansia sp. RSA 475]